MSKPTQAQIEAAHSAYYKAMQDDKPLDECWVAALTAAAEVGDDNGWNYAERLNLAIKNTQAATIERCAKVAEKRAAQYDHQNNNQENALWQECLEIAAAIRALKDKP